MKPFNLEKYSGVVHEVLNALNIRKGGKMAWTALATDKKISNNFGTVLMRIGLVEKIKNGEYRSNLGVPYITHKQADSIANVIKDNDLIHFPKNDVTIAKAKEAISKMGVIRDENKLQKRGRKAKVAQPAQVMQPVQATKPTQATPSVTFVKSVPAQLTDLSQYSTQEILQELGKRINK